MSPSFAPEQLEPLFTTGDAGPAAGPDFTLRVTGTFDAPSFLSESTGAFQPKVLLSPAFVDSHGGQVATYPGGLTLRLQRGSADWLLVCTAGTGCALVDVERALYVLDRRVGKAPKTGRNWREYADAVMDKRAAAH